MMLRFGAFWNRFALPSEEASEDLPLRGDARPTVAKMFPDADAAFQAGGSQRNRGRMGKKIYIVAGETSGDSRGRS